MPGLAEAAVVTDDLIIKVKGGMPWPTKGMIFGELHQNLDEFADYLRKLADQMARRGVWWDWVKEAPHGAEIRFPVDALEACGDPIVRRTMDLRRHMLEARLTLIKMRDEQAKADG